MRCEGARKQMDALLDDLLSGPRAERVRSHIRECAACGAEFAARSDLQVALRSLPAEPLPEGLQMRLHRRLAAAIPEPRRVRWWGPALPAATAVAGFLAAAAVAAPLLSGSAAQSFSPVTRSHAANTATLAPIQSDGVSPDQRTGGAAAYAAAGASTGVINGPQTVYGVNVPEPSPTPKAAAAMAPMQRAANQASTSSSTTPSVSLTSGAVASQSLAVPGSDTPATATDPAAMSLTILAAQPMQAVADLTQIAAEGGGHVIATFPAHAADPSQEGAPEPVATLDALIPASAADAYARRAGNDGRILASVSSVPAATGAATANVRLMVTVLQAPAPTAHPAALQSPPPAAGDPVARAVLQDAARVAPWAGGAAVVGLLGLVLGRFTRRS